MKRIFLDHAATTPLAKEVKKTMDIYAAEQFGNPNSLHREGVVARRAVEDARAEAARFFGALPEEIVFTGGGTEANNMAIRGVFEELEQSGTALADCHAITSVIEHSSVLEVFQALESKGLAVTYAGVDGSGGVCVQEIKEALRANTKLVSIMYANNEIGTIQPVHEIAKAVRHFRGGREDGYPLVHTDACQALQCLPVGVRPLGADLLSASAQKVYGPKGVGLLFVKRGTPFAPIMYGGGQERGLRPGTENVAGIAGFGRALAMTAQVRGKECARQSSLRAYLVSELKTAFPDAVLNGDSEDQLPHIVSVSFPGVDQEELVLRLDAKGVAVAARSACKEKDLDVSYTVAALGEKHHPGSAIRFSIGRETRKRDLNFTVKTLKNIFTTIIK